MHQSRSCASTARPWCPWANSPNYQGVPAHGRRAAPGRARRGARPSRSSVTARRGSGRRTAASSLAEGKRQGFAPFGVDLFDYVALPGLPAWRRHDPDPRPIRAAARPSRALTAGAAAST